MTLADSTASSFDKSNSAAFRSYRWTKSKANQAPTPAATSRIKSVITKNFRKKNGGRRRFGSLISVHLSFNSSVQTPFTGYRPDQMESLGAPASLGPGV